MFIRNVRTTTSIELVCSVDLASITSPISIPRLYSGFTRKGRIPVPWVEMDDVPIIHFGMSLKSQHNVLVSRCSLYIS